jgi:biotin operon repressor
MGYSLSNISRVAVWYHINALEHKGWISREPKTSRSLIPLVYLEEILDKEGLPDLSMPVTS